MVDTHRRTARHTPLGMVWPLVIAVLTPPIVIASALILLSLLGVFVVWLGIVAAILVTILIADGVRGSLRRLAPALLATLERPAVGVPGR
jgi:hypothetical protein